jgi:hypothetical protein
MPRQRKSIFIVAEHKSFVQALTILNSNLNNKIINNAEISDIDIQNSAVIIDPTTNVYICSQQVIVTADSDYLNCLDSIIHIV